MAEVEHPIAVFLSVVSSLLVGLMLILVPWTTLWDSNYFIGPHPGLSLWVLSAFTRGAVSGLGVINVLLAFHEAHAHLASNIERG